MPCRIAHVFKIVMFATRAHTALRGHRALVLALVVAKEDVLELHHAGIREQQCRIVAGDERRTRDNLVALPMEEFQKSAAQLVAGHVFHVLFESPAGWTPTRLLVTTVV